MRYRFKRVLFGAILAVSQAAVLVSAGTVPVVSSHQTIKASHFGKTPVLRKLQYLNLPPVLRRTIRSRHPSPAAIQRLWDRLARAGYVQPRSAKIQIPLRHKPFGAAPLRPVQDPDVQKALPSRVQRLMSVAPKDFTAPSFGFDGLGQSNGDDIPCSPPDTDIAVGVDQIVEEVNCAGGSIGTTFAVFSKSDGSNLLGPVALGNLWSSVGGVCADNTWGDGVVLYDQLANRWVLTQLAGDPVPTDECVAVSQSSDATGAYFVYDFTVYPGRFMDYPKLAVWPDAYYQSFNGFYQEAGFISGGFVALDRAAMLRGDPNAQMVLFPVGFEGRVEYAYSLLPADLDGNVPPPDGAPGLFVDYVSPNADLLSYTALEMWQLHVDWSDPDAASLTGPTRIDIDPMNDLVCYLTWSPDCIPQPVGGEGLDPLSDRLMFRLAYRNGLGADGHQALVMNQTVGAKDLNPPTGIRWYELDAPAGSVDPADWTLAQQGTFAPDDGNSRWMGSIAMDHSGDIALGYSISSIAMPPSIAYTGRLATDPAGLMTQPETYLLHGSGVQAETDHRWGDYSSLVVDPTGDCTFWYAQEYYAVSGYSNWSTHIGSFRFANCTTGATGTVSGQVSDASTGAGIADANIVLSPGKIITTTDAGGHFSVNLPAGTYSVAVSKFRYQPASATVTSSDGTVTSRDFALALAPVATVSGRVTDAAHGYGLYASVTVTSPGAGQVAKVWTNPQTGAYSVSLPESSDYTFATAGYSRGFQPGASDITNLSGDQTLDVSLGPDSSCSAPGYAFATGFGTDFDEGFPPDGWSVVTPVDNGVTVWRPNGGENRDENYTTGKGIAAEANSDDAISLNEEGPYDTQLISPPIAVSSLGSATTLRFKYVYAPGARGDTFDVDITSDGGATWSNVLHFHAGVSCGVPYFKTDCLAQIDLAPFLPPSGSIQLRWRYYNAAAGAWGFYVQVDDVGIGDCVPRPGGMVIGQVKDKDTGAGIVGAKVANADVPSDAAQSVENSADANLPVGMYFLFYDTSGGDSGMLRGSASRHTPVEVPVTAVTGGLVKKDIAIGSAHFAVSPDQVELHVKSGETQSATLAVENTGSSQGGYHFLTFNALPLTSYSLPAQAVTATVHLHCAMLSPLSAMALARQTEEGGQCSSDAESAQATTADAWAPVADLPTKIMDNGVATDEASGLVYSVGGYNGNAAVASAYVYDPVTDRWRQIADLPNALDAPDAVFVGGKLYVANGWDGYTGEVNQWMYIYDPSSGQWTTTQPRVISGGGTAAVALGGKIYFIGGCGYNSCTANKSTVIFDPAANTWSFGANYPHYVSWASCGAIAGMIYCAGGRDDDRGYADGYVYDPDADQWSPIASIPVASGGLWGASYSATPNGLLIAGGATAGGITTSALIYDPVSNSWSALPNTVEPLYRGGGACGFYQVGGTAGDIADAVSHAATLAGNEPCHTSAIRWLSLDKMDGTVASGSSGTVQLTINGAGQRGSTDSTAYLYLAANTPYSPEVIPVVVHWDPIFVNLGVTASASTGSIKKGGTVVYNVNVSNRSVSGRDLVNATGTTVSYHLPAGASYVGASGDASCAANNGDMVCDFGTVPLGASKAVQLTIRLNQIGDAENAFMVSSNEDDINSTDSATVQTHVYGTADVRIVTYSASDPAIVVGGTVTYFVAVYNAGPDQADSVQLRAPLPAALKYVSAASTRGSCSFVSGTVECSLGTVPLSNGSDDSVTITATAAANGTFHTQVSVSGASDDPDTSNNHAQTSLIVEAAKADASDSKSNAGGGAAGFGMVIFLMLAIGLRRRRLKL